MVLVNGRQLAELMIDHGVGVSVETTYVIRRIDLDYSGAEDAVVLPGVTPSALLNTGRVARTCSVAISPSKARSSLPPSSDR